MRGAIGLIVYVIVMLISSVVKMVAEEKAKQRRRLMGQSDQETYTVTLEDMLTEEQPSGDSQRDFGPDEVTEQRDQEPQKEWPEWDDWDYDDRDGVTPQLTAPVGGAHMGSKRLDLAQAIVLSEVVREPRALRRWPSR